MELFYQGQHYQSVWSCSTKGNTTKEYFPIVAERLNMNISTNQHLTTMLTGHGNIKSGLHHFKITTSPSCPCGKNDKTTDTYFTNVNYLRHKEKT